MMTNIPPIILLSGQWCVLLLLVLRVDLRLLLKALLLNELLLENLVDLLGGHADGFVARLHQTFDFGSENDQLGLVQFDRVLALDQCPIDAFQDTLLDGFLVAFKSPDQELHVGLHEENLALFLLA